MDGQKNNQIGQPGPWTSSESAAAPYPSAPMDPEKSMPQTGQPGIFNNYWNQWFNAWNQSFNQTWMYPPNNMANRYSPFTPTLHLGCNQ